MQPPPMDNGLTMSPRTYNTGILGFWAFSLALAALMVLTTGDMAYAGGLDSAINTVKDYALGFREPLGIAAVIGLGIGVASGRASWTQALIVGIGVIITVQYSTIAGSLGNPDTVMSDIRSGAIAIGPPIAMISIIALGVGAMFGRISWNQALIVAMGVIILGRPDTIYSAMAR